MVYLIFPDDMPAASERLMRTPGLPATLAIAASITIAVSHLFDRERVGEVNAAHREAMLTHPIIMVGGQVAGFAHIHLTLLPLDRSSFTIESLDYFSLGIGWRPMIRAGAILASQREPDPAWLR